MASNIANRLRQARTLAVAGVTLFAVGCGGNQLTQRETLRARFLQYVEKGCNIKLQKPYDAKKSEFDGDTLDVLFYTREGDSGIYRMSIEAFGYKLNGRSKKFHPGDTMYVASFLDELIKDKEAVVPKDPEKEISPFEML